MKDSLRAPSTEVARHAHVALALWAGALTWMLRLDDPRLRYPAFLAGAVVAIAAQLALVSWARSGRFPPNLWRLAVVFGIGARIGALAQNPAFSEDVFRYVFEGRVALGHGIAFPFVHPPIDAPSLGVDPRLLDASWLRINHAPVPTLYPPLAQGTFILAAAIGDLFGDAHLFVLKIFLVAADLGAWALIAVTLRALGRNVEESAIWGLSPLVIVEVAREGHLDSLSALGLALGSFGFVTLRPRIGYAGWALAALAKLNGLFVLPAAIRTERRGLAIALVLSSFLAIPFILAGSEATTGVGAYASSWRAGDGAFSIVLLAAERLLGGDWKDFGSFVLTRHQLARAMTGALYLVIATAILWRPAPAERAARTEAILERAAALMLFLLLLSPTVHPWYTIWILALAPFGGRWRAPMLALAAMVWLNHLPVWLELESGEWREVAAVRALVHLPAWGLVLAGFVVRRPDQSLTAGV